MPNIKSAIKRVRTTESNAKEVEHAANKNVIKANTASRKKSSLAKELNTIK